MTSVSDAEIEKFFRNETNDDFKENFVAVHPIQ